MDNIAEAKLCPDGLLFEDGNPNQEKCDYPFNVNCGSREFVRKLTFFLLLSAILIREHSLMTSRKEREGVWAFCDNRA